MDTILLNIIKMLTERKFLDKDKLDKNYKILLDQKNEERIFVIKSNFSNKKYHILFVFGKLTTIKKISNLDSFLSTTEDDNRMFIVNNANQKAYKQFIELENTEVFFDYELMMNIIEHELQPIFEVLDIEEKKLFHEAYNTENNMSMMLSTDPIARYYRLTHGDVIRIIRPSNSSGIGFQYRKIIESPISVLFE